MASLTLRSRDREEKQTMKFKETLVVVKDCSKAFKFYQDIFGFELIRDHDGNMLRKYRLCEVWGVKNRRPELYGEISDKGYVYDKN